MPNMTLHQPSRGATLSLGYITVGTLLMIWTGLWYWRMQTTGEPPPPESLQNLTCLGFFLSGAALVVIGLLVGRIGSEAKHADVPMGQIQAAAVTPQPNTAAAPAAGAAATAPVAGAVAANATPQPAGTQPAAQPAAPTQPQRISAG
jgi:hypothetical protein